MTDPRRRSEEPLCVNQPNPPAACRPLALAVEVLVDFVAFLVSAAGATQRLSPLAIRLVVIVLTAGEVTARKARP